MTIEQFNDINTIAVIYKKYFPKWRIGQTFFNILSDLHPEISERIRGTSDDMFHKNNIDWHKDFIKKYVND